MPTNDFLPFGSAVGANVSTQAEYAALAARQNGFSSGTAVSKQLNKAWRQSSVMSATLAQFIADQSGNDVLDNGNLATIQTNLALAVAAAVASGIPYASQVEAVAGTAPNKVMSPLRVFQAIAQVVQQATESAFGWLKIATTLQVTTGTDNSTAVTPLKLATAAQAQPFNTVTTAGTGSAYTITPVPAAAAPSFGQRFLVSFHTDSLPGNPTINVSGRAAKVLKQYNSSGAKVAPVIVAGQVFDMVYDGTDFVLLGQLQSLTDFLNSTRVDVASAGSTNLTSSAPNTRHINITGTTNITSFTVAVGQCYFVRFDGVLQIANNAAIATQSGANIQTQAGDTCILRATAVNVVEVLCYTRSAKSLCTAWVSWNGTGTVAVRDSYNVSSITDNGTGDFTVNFATPMASANYSFSYTVGGSVNVINMASGSTTAPTVSALRVTSVSAAGIGTGANFQMTDFPINNVQIFGGKV